MTIYRSAVLLCTAIVVGSGMGCGSGGPSAAISGLVTDVDGKAVAGATVAVSGRTTSSLSNGTFTLPSVGSGVKTVTADITVNGHHFSGETKVDAVGSEKNRSINVMISDERFQGAIAGTVIDGSGFAILGAKVFVGGPLGSTLALTRSDGSYRVPKLTSGVTYTVVCSFAGFKNETKSVRVDSGLTSAASFALGVGTSAGAIPAPLNVTAQAWTIADTISRSSGKSRGVYDWLKRRYRLKAGLPNLPQAKQIERKGAARSTPLGSVIEVDLFWDYESFNDLLGYLIRRGPSSSTLADTAVVRDPLTSVFFDVDTVLTPNSQVFYTVHRLDTIDFPARGTVGPPSAVVSANPLGPISALDPAQGARVTGDPLFTWSAVSGASTYQIYVWDFFPDLQNGSDPDGVVPIWPANLSLPGTSLVTAPRTSQRYEGPVLSSGRDYYWLVVAEDASGKALSATQVARFRPN